MCDFTNCTNCTKVYNMSDSSDLPISFLEMKETDQCGNFIIMDIGEPVTITAKESFTFSRSVCFTTYLIRVETNYPTFTNSFSAVRRRYSEFWWLRLQLLANHSDEVVPPLPPKKYLRFLNFNSTVIHERLIGLSNFLQRVLETPAFLSDPALLFFLQSDLSVQEMEEKSKGQPVSFHTSQEISVDPVVGQHKPSSPISLPCDNLQRENRLARSLSTGSEQSDRVSSDDGQGYESSKADSGHFEESLSAESSMGQGKLGRNKLRRKLASDYSAASDKTGLPRNATFKEEPSANNEYSPLVNELLMFNPMNCYAMMSQP